MRILVCTATELELQPTSDWLEHQRAGVKLLTTGVGMLSATYAITQAVLREKYDWVIQAGIAGSLDDQLTLGEVVAVDTETIGDLGVLEHEGHFQSVFQMGLSDENKHPWKEGKLANPHVTAFPQLKAVHGVTVNEITTNKERVETYRLRDNAAIETMEGAALHLTCLMERIPFLQLRGISNKVGIRNKKDWRMQEAIENVNEVLKTVIKTLS